jgi:hypothetical protein
MRTFSRFLVVLPILCLCIYFQTRAVKFHPVAPRPADVPKEVEITAATPEDPGPVATVVSPLETWTKQSDAPVDTDEPKFLLVADHADTTPHPPANHLVHKQFVVNPYCEFPFIVPAHIVNPTLRGNFRAFANDSANAADSPPRVDLMLMNEQQFHDFVRGRQCNIGYQAKLSSSQSVNLAIPATHDRAQAYHLVFRNPSGTGLTSVNADFTVSFE